MWQQRVGRDLCWSVWSESRGGAPFCWLSVPLCSPTVVKLLTGTFHERWRKCTIYSFTPTHTHTHTLALTVYTHTWRAYMALHGVLVLSQQLLPTTHHHTFHLAVSRQSILLQLSCLKRAGMCVYVCVWVSECVSESYAWRRRTTVKVVYVQSASFQPHYVL